jgi:predicted dehydrogenase
VTAPDVLVLGAGSIGRRHARNLASAGARVALADPAAIEGTDDPVGVTRIPWADADPGRFAGVVVASPTVHHLDQATVAVAAGAGVLVEKPLATTVAGGESLRGDNDHVRVGFNLRYHEPIRRLMDLVHGGRAGRVVGARLWFGYHLPSWRPGVDYRQTYSARADLGGGILLDAIHELDLAVWLLGPDLVVESALVARVGDLELDVEDTVRAQLRTADEVPVEIALDYLSRDYRRGIEVVGTDATIRLDWARNVLEVADGNDVTVEAAGASVDRSYEAEATSFLGWLTGTDDLPVDVETALVSLRLADEIRERSA